MKANRNCRSFRYSIRTLLAAVTIVCLTTAILIAVYFPRTPQALIVRPTAPNSWSFEIRPGREHRGAMTLEVRSRSYLGAANKVGPTPLLRQSAETIDEISRFEVAIPFDLLVSVDPAHSPTIPPVLNVAHDGAKSTYVLKGTKHFGFFTGLMSDWEGGELHLLNVFTADGETIYTNEGTTVFVHDLVLVRDEK